MRTTCILLRLLCLVLFGVLALLWDKYNQVRMELRQRRAAAHDAFYDTDAVAATKKDGEQIAEALQHYREEHGSYPRHLDALQPDYLRKITLPIAGEPRWGYWYSNDPSEPYVTLTFGVDPFNMYDLYPCYTYDSNDGEWSADF